MARVTYPPGDTTASRIKTLVLWTQKKHGRAAAESLVRDVRIDPEYLEDETRPVPVATWYRALLEFESCYGRDALLETWTAVIDAENLGVWTRVLRGTIDPEGALAQLDALGGEELKTYRWETIEVRRGRWHGRVTLTHDPALERDGLCNLARMAELMSVPAMFGFGAGKVVPVPTAREAVTSRTGSVSEEYLMTWRVPEARREQLAGAALVALAPAILLLHGSILIAAALLVVGVLVAIAGTAYQGSLQRRAESVSQMNRIRALERSVTLKEQRERAAVGFFEGSMIAGKYRLGRKLGAGASGVIHQATRLADNAPVAIKLLRAAVAHDTVASDRLRREAEALGLTWHPNVVEVFEHDHLPDGTAYLVMEQLEGESLATRLRLRGRLGAEEVLHIVTQVCDALGAVHAAGVIHRDVKPSNIFLAFEAPGDPDDVKLLDFGIARVEWAETRLTNMGAPLGTPGYMSPEQEQGGEIDARSDLYALGAVIYECFVGVPPPTTVSGSFEIVAPGERGVRLDVSVQAMPAEWRAIVNRAMAPLPQARYRDARAMREALAQLSHLPSNDDATTSADAARAGARSVTDVRKTNVSK
jgi:hypothetical protein